MKSYKIFIAALLLLYSLLPCSLVATAQTMNFYGFYNRIENHYHV